MAHRSIGADELDALSGSFATVLTTQQSVDNFSGSLCALSANEDDSTMTVVPLVGNVALSTVATDRQTSSASPDNRRKLFFAQASPETTEAQLKQWFSQYGQVESVQLLNDGSCSLGSGCGYVTMATNDQAAAALAAMQQNPQLPSPVGFLNVNYPLAEEAAAAPAPAISSQMSQLAANADRTLFFAKVPPTALASEVELLFGSFGKLAEVNLFRAWAGAKHSKGCGLITYVDRQSAANAIAQLHGKYVFPGSDCPMVVEWMDMKKQRPVAPPPPADKAPLGCAHDAYKLLLGNIPLTVTEADMAAMLRKFGEVVQLVITPDNAGATASGHVWYATKQAADALQARVKAAPLWLRDARTNQDLALCVRRSRKPGMLGPCRQNSATPIGANMSNSSNSSSSLLPLIHMGSGDLSSQLMQMQRLNTVHSGMDLSMLGPDVIRLLPMQQQQPQLGSGALPQMAAGVGYMAADVCEAMLDAYDHSNMSLSMPVHLQPSIAAQQLANNIALQRANQQRTANSQVCVLTNGMLQSSGQHCMSSPANILTGLDEFEGSFNMSLPKAMSNNLGNIGVNGISMNGMQTNTQQQVMGIGQQQLMQQGGMVWQQQLPQQQQFVQISQPQQQQVLVMPQSTAMVSPNGQLQMIPQQQTNVAATKSIAVPIDSHEVHMVAENLMLLSARSGAQVTITSLPGASLAIMISGRPDQVATAQSLLASLRNRK